MKLVNISNNKRIINLFLRDDEGKLIIKNDTTFFPYFYEPIIEPNEKEDILGYDGTRLKKIFANNPSDVPKMRSDEHWSGDVLYPKRYVYDKVDKFDKCIFKYIFFDIENEKVDSPKEFPNPEEAKFPVSCITGWDNFSKKYVTFDIEDCKEEGILLNRFMKYLREQSPDILLAWNIDFDYTYLHNRVKFFPHKISPIGQTRNANFSKNKKKGEDNEDGFEKKIYYPCGISILDYLTLFKKVFLRESGFALDVVAQRHLKTEHWTGGFTREKNIEDVKKMVKLEEKYNILNYFDEIRRMTKTFWEDLPNNSYIVENLLFEEAKLMNVALPAKPRERVDETISGAIREARETGPKFSLGKYDLGCVDEQTEILSEDGWKKYNEVKKGDIVATFNIEKNKVEFDSILHLNVKEVKNLNMIKFKNSCYINQLLTETHKVLYRNTCKSYKRKYNVNDWRISFARDIPVLHTVLPTTFEMIDREDYNISDELIKLHAWIITEGWTPRTNKGKIVGRYISQSPLKNAKYVKEIDQIIKKLCWEVTRKHRKRFIKIDKGRRYNEEINWYIPARYKDKIFLEKNHKVIPSWMIKSFSKRQLKILMVELIKGDGAKAGHVYYAKDKLARDRFQHLCTLLGYSTYKNDIKEVYYKKNNFIGSGGLKFKSKVKYTGIVWCPTVKNGFVVMRRGGSVFITGNSAYPSAITDFCLDSSNIKYEALENTVSVNDLFFVQDGNKLLPRAVKKILVLKNNLKKEVGECENEEKKKDLEVKYNAIKGVINSCYGALSYSRFRLFDNRVASTITFLVRDLLAYVIKELEKDGIKVIYYDTDSIFINITEDITEKLNDLIIQWGIEKYNNDKVTIKFEREGYFEKIFILAKTRYIGYLRNPEGGLKEEIKGIEAKRSSSAEFQKKFQKELFEKILSYKSIEEINAHKDGIEDWIIAQRSILKKRPLEEFAFPCKISVNKKYVNTPIFVRALKSTQRLKREFDVNKGQSFFYLYMGYDKDVLAFKIDDQDFIDRERINWNQMIGRNIDNMSERIFAATGWTYNPLGQMFFEY